MPLRSKHGRGIGEKYGDGPQKGLEPFWNQSDGRAKARRKVEVVLWLGLAHLYG